MYSGGVRQEAYHLFNRGSEEANASMVVHSGYHPAIEELVHKAKFCLAPYGWGWGIRISEVRCGCCSEQMQHAPCVCLPSTCGVPQYNVPCLAAAELHATLLLISRAKHALLVCQADSAG